MKSIRIRIHDLIDEHGDTFNQCPGCSLCKEITRLRKQLPNREPDKKFAHILAKGLDMTRSDIEMLLDNEVDRKTIYKALGLANGKGIQFLKDLRLSKEELQVAKLTKEQYLEMTGEGMTDWQICDKVGIHHNYLPQLKKKWFNDTEKPKLAVVEPKQGDNSQKDNSTEYERLLQELKRQVETEKANAKNYRDQLLDTRHEFTQQSYTVENQKHVIENFNKTIQRYEKENKALRELVALWV